jgi:hypothetical protein
MPAKNLMRFLPIALLTLTLTSCANMQAMIDSQTQEQKEISVEQKLQVSIPLPENSKYLVDKTVIFGDIYNMKKQQMTQLAFIEKI